MRDKNHLPFLFKCGDDSLMLVSEGDVTHTGSITVERLSDGETATCIIEWHHTDPDGKYFGVIDCFPGLTPGLNIPTVYDDLRLPKIDSDDIEVDDDRCYFSNVTKQPNPLTNKGFYIVIEQFYPAPYLTRERPVIRRISTGATASVFMDNLKD